MRRTKTFTVEYNYFEPGTIVTPTSNRGPLAHGETYVVTKCVEPQYAGDECVVLLSGQMYGVNTEYLSEVDVWW